MGDDLQPRQNLRANRPSQTGSSGSGDPQQGSNYIQARQQQQQYQYQQYHHHQQQQQQRLPYPVPHQPFQPQVPLNVQQSPFDMSTMAHTLQTATYRQQQYDPGAQRFNSTIHSPGNSLQTSPVSQYPPNQLGAQPFYMPQSTQIPTPAYYGSHMPMMQQPGTGMEQQHGYNFYHGQIPPASPYHYTHPSQYPLQNNEKPRSSSQAVIVSSSTAYAQQSSQKQQRKLQSDNRASNVVRGPPRKPKQSGHAIWIGNLPPQTNLMDLVHHVCEKTEGLESLFLISKSNCAFANYENEQSCLDAQQKINDTRFMSVRLVSRLRKNSVEITAGASPPTGPASSTPPVQPPDKPQQKETQDPTPDAVDTEDEGTKGKTMSSSTGVVVTSTSVAETPIITAGTEKTNGFGSRDRFFILKSLTVEDLESSVQTGIWATQSHNEETLNNAFKTCDSVYLIFSANKSGEYFGYAKMVSEINEDPEAAIEFAPKAQAFSDTDLPKAIPTEATQFAPPGRIIDDSARGTIFWEAQRDETTDGKESEKGNNADKGDKYGKEDKEDKKDKEDKNDPAASGDAADEANSVKSGGAAEAGSEPQAWGKPFRLEWVSTGKVPFYRTRGMRNPLNANRDIKIARDGTEVDPAVGQRLIALFHQPAVIQGTSGTGQAMPMYPVVHE